MKAREVFHGSDGAITRRYYAELEQIGPIGVIAMNLFRAQKCSTRAKLYRGGIRGVGSYRGMAYDRKGWSLEKLCEALFEHNLIRYGWKVDPLEDRNPWVLYVDLPEGQVSFHSPNRYAGPEYAGDWDGILGASADRILAFCDRVTHQPDPRQLVMTLDRDREPILNQLGPPKPPEPAPKGPRRPRQLNVGQPLISEDLAGGAGGNRTPE